MANQTSSPQRRPLSYLTDNKHYLGGYLNIARHNAYLILKYLSAKFGYAPERIKEENLENAAILSSLEKNEMLYYRKEKIADELMYLFPFLRAFHQEEEDAKLDPALVSGHLRNLLEILSDLRNEYSHFHYRAKEMQRLPELDKIFEASRKGILLRFKDTIREKNTKHLSSEWYKLFADSSSLTVVGKIFLTCLFLDRENAFKFLSGINGFSTGKPDYNATVACFTHFCSRVPKPRLQSDFLGLDILNELSRCPSEVYFRLKKEDQEKFEYKPEEYEDIHQEDETVYLRPLILRRYKDRFPYFILRFFDEMKWFETLRFQLYFGRLNTVGYKKEMAGVKAERRVLNALTAYMRWNEISDEVIETIPDSWKDHSKQRLRSEIEQFRKKYNIRDQKIAIKILPDKKAKIFSKVRQQSEPLHLTVKAPVPDAILSVYELPNLFVYTWLYKKGKIDKSPEDFIKDYRDQFRRFCKDVQNGEVMPNPESYEEVLSAYGLKPHFLPEKLLDYLKGGVSQNIKLSLQKKIVRKIQETESLLKQASKPLDGKVRKPKVGEMATFLARDIVFLLPSQSKSGIAKPNNEEFNELQTLFAYFGKEKDRIIGLFQELNLIDGNAPGTRHPFLSKLLAKAVWREMRGIRDFYKWYLAEKLKWLKEVKTEVGGEDDDCLEGYLDFFPVDMKSGKSKNYLSVPQAGEEADVEAPVVLPRGLFNDAIRNAFTSERGLEVKKGDNLIFILEQYFKGKEQPFYRYPRIYEVRLSKTAKPFEIDTSMEEDVITKRLDALKKKIATSSGEAKALWKGLKKKFMNNEKRIRFTKAKDKLLWLATEVLLTSNEGGDYSLEMDFSKISLSEVGFDLRGRSILRKEIVMRLEHHGRFITDTGSLKNYGKFRRFIKDRRLWEANKDEETGLLLYWEEGEEIPLETLRAMVASYDKTRVEVFEKVLLFEKVLQEKFPEMFKKDGNYLPHWVQLKFFADRHPDFAWEPFSMRHLSKLRNKYFHNQFPHYDWLSSVLPGNIEKVEIPRQIAELTKDAYERLIYELQSDV